MALERVVTTIESDVKQRLAEAAGALGVSEFAYVRMCLERAAEVNGIADAVRGAVKQSAQETLGDFCAELAVEVERAIGQISEAARSNQDGLSAYCEEFTRVLIKNTPGGDRPPAPASHSNPATAPVSPGGFAATR